MSTFVLEIGTEEIPAGFLESYGRELAARFKAALDKSAFEHGAIRALTTPRRAAVIVSDLAHVQKDIEEIITGPSVSAAYDSQNMPTRALTGFLRGHNMSEKDVFRVHKGKGEYVAVRKTGGGKQAAEILAEICPAIISSLPFPKRMRWGANEMPYARPIRWIVSLLGSETVPFSIGPVKADRFTEGHRVHGKGPFAIGHADEYEDIIANSCGVTLSPELRRKKIIDDGDALASARHGRVLWKESLLDEVQGLVEHPVPMLGDFADSYLEIPREVLLTSMETHQKSFGLEDENGNILPHFLTVLNISSKDEALVKKGWERVLKARLEDARFFWQTDLSHDFGQWLDKLDSVIFIGQLGSMGDKSRRLEKLCSWICSNLPQCSPESGLAARAGRLSKADLVSGMVGEFDSLQGIMGGIYAEKMGEDPRVARAVGEQYLPAGPDSPLPGTILGSVLSIADKADTLAGCFGLGMLPTGAADPNGLRRCALGIIRIALAFDIELKAGDLFRKAIALYGDRAWKVPPGESVDALLAFFEGRLRNYFISQGYEIRIVDAALNAGFENVPKCAARLEALSAFCTTPDYSDAVRTFKRVANILKQADMESLPENWDRSLLEGEAEKNLSEVLEGILPDMDRMLEDGKYADMLDTLLKLRPAVDSFFDNVMVMAEDTDLRQNRLAMLNQLGSRFARVADFSALQI